MVQKLFIVKAGFAFDNCNLIAVCKAMIEQDIEDQ
jgi:hypothetical protein